MITAGSENKELAHEFLEYMIEAQTQKKITDVTGLHSGESAGGAVHDSGRSEGRCTWTTWIITRSDLTFGRMCRGAPKYNEIWNEVKAAQ